MASIVIFAIMLIFGFIISDKLSDSIEEDNTVYTTALRINSKEMFKYGMETSVGNAFIYGNLKAIDTVSYSEIDGEYMYLKKIKERYTKHTKRVKHTVGSGENKRTYYTTEEYWTWDVIETKRKHSKEVSFLGVRFPYEKLSIPSATYIETIQESSKIRYKYYGCKTKYTGTLFANLKDNTMLNTSQLYINMDIDKALESYLLDDSDITVFWILWVILTCVLIFAFCYLDNKWLED